MEWLGYLGVVAFALAWIPQCLETIRAGRCGANLGFLLLAALGSASLAAYAFWRGDAVFCVLNTLTTAGALLNVGYALRGAPWPARCDMEKKEDPSLMKKKARTLRRESVSSILGRDHDEIDALLSRVPFQSAPEDLPAFLAFHHRLERHIGFEEDVLFPAVIRVQPAIESGPLAVMRTEHLAIRRHKAAALSALKEGDAALARREAEAMRGVLRGHNEKEEAILYPFCDHLHDAEESSRVIAAAAAALGPARGTEAAAGA